VSSSFGLSVQARDGADFFPFSAILLADEEERPFDLRMIIRARTQRRQNGLRTLEDLS
jgi:hypothetical protein